MQKNQRSKPLQTRFQPTSIYEYTLKCQLFSNSSQNQEHLLMSITFQIF